MDEDPYERKPSPMDGLFKAIKISYPKDDKLRALLAETDPKALSEKDPESGDTPITYAADKGHIRGLVLMLEHKGDPNARNEFNDSPLHSAMRGNQPDAVKYLLKHKADVLNCGTELCDPLQYAAEHCCVPIVEMMLEAGGNPDRGTVTARQYVANALKTNPTNRRYMGMAAAIEKYPAK